MCRYVCVAVVHYCTTFTLSWLRLRVRTHSLSSKHWQLTSMCLSKFCLETSLHDGVLLISPGGHFKRLYSERPDFAAGPT